jgi:hypothetical protein
LHRYDDWLILFAACVSASVHFLKDTLPRLLIVEVTIVYGFIGNRTNLK